MLPVIGLMSEYLSYGTVSILVRDTRSEMEPDFNDSSASAWSKSSTGFALPFPFLSAFDCFCGRGWGVDGGSGPACKVGVLRAAAAADGFFFFFLFYLTLRLVSIDNNRSEVGRDIGQAEIEG